MSLSLKNVFALLNPKLKESLIKNGIEEPTEAQRIAIPEILKGNNILLISPTGSGKTEAALLPVIDRIFRERPEPISLLYITPLRALNRDMLSRLYTYCDNLNIKVQVRHSDITQSQRDEISKSPGNILITTPESLQLMMSGKKLRGHLKNVKFVIIDEVHEMAQNERGSQFSIAMERLKSIAGKIQIIGLSATVKNEDELSKFIAPEGNIKILKPSINKKMDISVIYPEPTDPEISEKMGCDPQYAGCISEIYHIVEKNRGTIVFVNRRYVAEDMAFRLSLWINHPDLEVHHGSLSKESRETAEMDFKTNKIRGIICTSSLELGIDIGTADVVAQFNSPRQINKMVQRIGRSGHSLEKTSRGIIVCNDTIELEEAVAIVDNINSGNLENVMIRKNSLSTVANQIMLELNYAKKIKYQDFYNIIKRAYPFWELSFEEYYSVIELLNRTKKLIIDGEYIIKRYSILKYYIENISMIPSDKTYSVIDTVNKKFIGTLDEKYVVNEIEPGSFFIIRGATWRTIRIQDGKIYVEPFPTAAIAPHWTGEEIPVLFETTSRVSENRKNHEIPGFINKRGADALLNWYKNDIASLDKIIIESYAGEIIIQILLGSLGNFTLGEILSGILTSVTGESVEMDYSPYHIYIKVSRNIAPSDIEKIIENIDINNIDGYIKSSARRSRFFNNVFLYEARKFGIITNDADIGRVRFEKIVDAYFNTPLYEDSMRKLIFDYMDINAVTEYLNGIKGVKFILRDKISESSNIFLSHYSERIMPLKPTKTILESIKNRLLNEEVILLCTSCGNKRTLKIRDIRDIKCPVCHSHLVASVSKFDEDSIKNIDDPLIKKRIIKNAHLVRERGLTAIMVMAARGVGPDTASRILEVSYLNEEDLIKRLLKAETDFAKNRQYW
ncbi:MULTISPECIES: DEAD/DEAH box helicase [unclassified Acidiplasma]|uniref:DEAD/DEAH box helicase n=1 Tax=unclassified Acidiplasma TaxID=2641301 RepID=UPI0005E74004|nr:MULTISPECIES: DEAD/DEAH box helicase [unclassified Acidiplasma]KJE50069.1 Lhr helicase [Acidiplasma sp. MBA-1]WMT55867.1 MAG: DEAD/DEAH box helicase [Acidiplasma sp.]